MANTNWKIVKLKLLANILFNAVNFITMFLKVQFKNFHLKRGKCGTIGPPIVLVLLVMFCGRAATS